MAIRHCPIKAIFAFFAFIQVRLYKFGGGLGLCGM
jgi:hypothetical protein